MENLSLEIQNDPAWLSLCELLQPEGQTIAEYNLLHGNLRMLNPFKEADPVIDVSTLLSSLERQQLSVFGQLLNSPKVQILLLISSDLHQLSRHWVKIRCTKRYESSGESRVLLVLDNITEKYKSELLDRMYLG